MMTRWGVVLLFPWLFGCSIVMSEQDVQEQIQFLKAQNGMGCAYISGSGTPPASRVDGAAAGSWGEGMSVQDFLECLHQLRGATE